MKEVLLAKEEGLRIALSILSGRIPAKEFGSAALRDTQLILKNILETEEVEKEMMKQREKPKTKAKPKRKKPNKKEVEANMAYFGQILNDMGKEGKTILDLENKHGKSN